MKICSVHSSEFVHKEGISRTSGKAFNFWCCPEKTADGEFCQDKGIEKGNYESAKAFDSSVTDNRSHRIERQHSQQMALQYLEAKGVTDFSREELKLTIDWFVRDLEN